MLYHATMLPRSFTLQPGPKVHENDDGLGIATIGVLHLGCAPYNYNHVFVALVIRPRFTGAFYVSPVTETRVAEVNAHAQKDRKIEAGSSSSWTLAKLHIYNKIIDIFASTWILE